MGIYGSSTVLLDQFTVGVRLITSLNIYAVYTHTYAGIEGGGAFGGGGGGRGEINLVQGT